MKTAYAAVICILAFLFSACVTGDEITCYVIDPDGSVAFSIYRLNLTSDQTGEKAKEELANYIRDLEKQSGNFFTKLAEANAKDLKTTILRRAAPSSVLITGCIPSLNDLATYASSKDNEASFVCTPISGGRTRGMRCQYTKIPSREKAKPEKAQTEPARTRADSFSETRIALAEGVFTRAQGFVIARDKRSALLDEEALSKVLDSQTRSFELSLEWQIPEEP